MDSKKLKICTIDGTAYYARWKVGEEYAYTEKERDWLIERLQKEGKETTVEELPEPPGFWVTRDAQGNPLKYASRTEAMRHIEQHELPESMTMPMMQQQLAEQEQWIAAALTVAQEARDRAEALESKLNDAESKNTEPGDPGKN